MNASSLANRLPAATLLTVGLALLIALTMIFAVAERAEAKTIVGNNKANRLVGTNQADFLRGLGGTDKLFGRLGNDRLYGGNGADAIKAGPGNDLLIGGAGNDRLIGDQGADRFQGGPGNDTIFAVKDVNRDYVECGPGSDVAYVGINDLVDGIQVRQITQDVNTVFSCELLVVNDIPLPVGLITVIPQDLLRQIVTGGDLSTLELLELNTIILGNLDEVSPGLVGLVRSLLGDLLG